MQHPENDVARPAGDDSGVEKNECLKDACLGMKKCGAVLFFNNKTIRNILNGMFSSIGSKETDILL